jgi:hypothetical protein
MRYRGVIEFRYLHCTDYRRAQNLQRILTGRGIIYLTEYNSGGEIFYFYIDDDNVQKGYRKY